MRLFVTGGAGFIGSHFSKVALWEHPEDSVVVFDKLTYAGNLGNLRELEGNPRFSFAKGDICDKAAVVRAASGCDWIVNFAAETHVDRSIVAAGDFVRTDVLGMHVLLEHCRKTGIPLLHISTDEVYGSIKAGSFCEDSPLLPNSPYSASKAGGDLLLRAYQKTYGLKAVVTRSSNNYGPNQHPEKLIPNFITRLLRGMKVPLYGRGGNIRDWIHVLDNCRGIDAVLRRGKPGEIYNIGGGNELSNIVIARMLLSLLGKGEDAIDFVTDRPGHDFRYSLDSRKASSLGWKPQIPFADGLKRTVEWYRQNEWWWKPLVGAG
jgi:dTDP-glucose 4,6-dehydratase